MKIGRMYTRLRWERPETSITVTGALLAKYTTLAYIRAERASMRATERNEAGEMYADIHAEYYVRYLHDIRRGDRLTEVSDEDTDSGALMEVTAVIANRRKGLKTVICDRVNL